MGVRTRKLKLGRPTLQSQTRYEWDYLYGAMEVVEGRAEFPHLPTVNLDCNALFLEHLCQAIPEPSMWSSPTKPVFICAGRPLCRMSA